MRRKHNVTIARSGIQYYTRDELPALGLRNVPEAYRSLRVFAVYRPAYHLEHAVDMFKKIPVVVGHQHWISGPADYERYVIGEVGDELKVKMIGDEATLFGTLSFTKEAMDTKESELSPGYKATCEWEAGEAPDGTPYQIIAREIREVNHLALVPRARGGDTIRILDGGSSVTKIMSGIIRYAKKTLGIGDGIEQEAFANVIKDAIENRQRWSTEEWQEHQITLMALLKDIPDSSDKEKLRRFVLDLPLISKEDEAISVKVGEVIVELYNKLDVDAIEDVIGDSEGEAKGEAMTEPKDEVVTEMQVDEKKEELQSSEQPASEVAQQQSEAPSEPVVEEPVEPVVPSENKEDQMIPERALGMAKELYTFLHKMFGATVAPDPAPAVDPVVAQESKEDPEAKQNTSDEVKEEPSEEKVEEPSKPEKEEEKIGDSAPEPPPMPLFSQKVGTAISATQSGMDGWYQSLKRRR